MDMDYMCISQASQSSSSSSFHDSTSQCLDAFLSGPCLDPAVLENAPSNPDNELWSPTMSQESSVPSLDDSISSFTPINTYRNNMRFNTLLDCESPPKLERTFSPRFSCKSNPKPSKQPSKKGRKAKPEFVVPGSARAVYLDKNRHAATKCRRKQKKQEEELVEKARGLEYKNKMLKAEVNLLRSDVTWLMDMFYQHHDCPDERIASFIQQKARRFASGE